MTPHEYYEKFLSRIEHMVYNAAALKLATFKYFDEQLAQNYIGTVKAFPLLPLLRDSLQIDCVMTLSKLLEDDRGDKTLQKFINYTATNRKSIKWSNNKDVAYEDITKQLELLEQINIEIKNLLTQRDKYFAHADNAYFFDPGKLSDDYPSAYNEMNLILSTIQGVISEHSCWFRGSMIASMSGYAYAHAERTLNFLQAASR